MDKHQFGPTVLYHNLRNGTFASVAAQVLNPDHPTTDTHSVAWADFDSDGDLDIYVGCSGTTANLPNMVFRNDGNAKFTLVPNGGGAQGTNLGRVDTLTAVDYDLDGCLDLYASNGSYPRPFSYAGLGQLFRGVGCGDNHWVELDLEGVRSNRDAIGATVYATTPDGKVQMREQGNGMHKSAQDYRRLHFGLAHNQSVDIRVVWPDGSRDVYPDLAATVCRLSANRAWPASASICRTAPAICWRRRRPTAAVSTCLPIFRLPVTRSRSSRPTAFGSRFRLSAAPTGAPTATPIPRPAWTPAVRV